MAPPAAIPEIVDVTVVAGSHAKADARPDLIIEIPHGATNTVDYTRLEARLTSPLPANLVDFFHVNTDAGAPELAVATARGFVAEDPARTVWVLRCRIPRTFIDCNRRVDASAADFKAGKVTPGLMPWITTAEDRALLRERYDRYVALVHAAMSQLADGGAILLLHTYAPRTVDVEVDADIVTNLRRAYEPEIEPTWSMRPQVDVIAHGSDGVDYTPRAVIDMLRVQLAKLDIAVADSATYPLHPSTLAWDHVQAHPGRAACIEVRRDLLAAPFDPFVEMTIGADKVDRLVPAFVSAIRAWW